VTEYWRAIGMPYPTAFLDIGSDLFVRKASLEYHGPAVFDDELDLCGRTARLGSTSMVFAVAMHRRGAAGRALVEAELVYVNLDPASRQPRALPQRLRQAITGFELTPPDEAARQDAR
jgi:acyl-CoA thioester hydrolase